MISRKWPHIFALVALWSAIATAVTMALLPHPPHVFLDRFGDKVEHSTAFAVIAWLSVLAYPNARLARIGERLSFLGALIEVAQSIPALHRDCDIFDWFADTGAIIAALLVAWVFRRIARRG
ncbi:MAG: hypothetical protein ABIS14_16355 [Sphingomonas sp.]